VGQKVPGFFNFVCLMEGRGQRVLSHGLSLTEDYLCGFDLHREVKMVFPGNAVHGAIWVRGDIFMACAEAMDRPDLDQRFLTANVVYMPETMASLRAYLNQLYGLFCQRSPLLAQPTFQRLILQDAVPLLIAALPLQREGLMHHPKGPQRWSLVKTAEDYMQAHLDQPLTLADLCQALGTSSRALSYGFQEIFGLSPMVYLKVLRLQGVRRALQSANPTVHTIAQMAARYGFWSLGHFARDYRQMFGERPQDTLRGG
jgi:AraC family ethanolamine operon transcriptional activator